MCACDRVVQSLLGAELRSTWREEAPVFEQHKNKEPCNEDHEKRDIAIYIGCFFGESGWLAHEGNTELQGWPVAGDRDEDDQGDDGQGNADADFHCGVAARIEIDHHCQKCTQQQSSEYGYSNHHIGNALHEDRVQDGHTQAEKQTVTKHVYGLVESISICETCLLV